MPAARNAASARLAGIAAERLNRQHIIAPACATPRDVVSWFGAVQAQDFAAMKWALGLRMREATDARVEAAIADGTIVRTWPLRNTLHVVATEDVRWMLALTGARMLARAASRYGQLELDDKTLRRSEAVLQRALEDGAQLTRVEIADALQRSRINTGGQRLIHIIQYAAVRGTICSAARRGKQFTFALLDDWIPAQEPWERERSLAELARRYFTSHGPAQLRDYVWWSGLTVADARGGIELAGADLETIDVDGIAHVRGSNAVHAADVTDSCVLLPFYDEYTVAYADRSAVSLRLRDAPFPSRGGILDPVVVCGGQVVATWKRTLQRTRVAITVSQLAKLTKKELRRVERAAQQYGEFVGLPAVVSFVA
jgi:hypothetical protein